MEEQQKIANKTKRTDLFLIDPRNIVVVDGFNVRVDYDLDELKEQIKANGVLNPLTVISFKDENGQEKYKLVDGERRYRAVMLAIEEGASIPWVKAIKVPRDASIEDLYIEQMMRNEGKRFSEYESAIMFRRFKEEFGYTQQEIADKFKKSQSFVSQCLSLLDLPPKILEQMVKGEISVKAAKEIIARYSSVTEQEEAADSVIKSAHDDGASTATRRQVRRHLNADNEIQELRDAIYKIRAYMNGEDVLRLSVLQDQLRYAKNLSTAFLFYRNKICSMKKSEQPAQKEND